MREQREREIEEKQKQQAIRESVVKAKADLSGPKQVGKIDLDKPKTEKKEAPKKAAAKKDEREEKYITKRCFHDIIFLLIHFDGYFLKNIKK